MDIKIVKICQTITMLQHLRQEEEELNFKLAKMGNKPVQEISGPRVDRVLHGHQELLRTSTLRMEEIHQELFNLENFIQHLNLHLPVFSLKRKRDDNADEEDDPEMTIAKRARHL